MRQDRDRDRQGQDKGPACEAGKRDMHTRGWVRRERGSSSGEAGTPERGRQAGRQHAGRQARAQRAGPADKQGPHGGGPPTGGPDRSVLRPDHHVRVLEPISPWSRPEGPVKGPESHSEPLSGAV